MEPAYSGPDRDLVDVMVADHRGFERAFVRLESGPDSPRYRRRLCDAVIADLMRHAVAEEEYLYPAVRELLPDGDQLAERMLAEHARTERVMKRLGAVDATDEEFPLLTRELIGRVRRQVREEERGLLPRLRVACPPGQLRYLAGMADMAKRSAPTRPHPHVPHRPPWNMLLAPGAGIIDRIRDAVSRRPGSGDDWSRHPDR